MSIEKILKFKYFLKKVSKLKTYFKQTAIMNSPKNFLLINHLTTLFGYTLQLHNIYYKLIKLFTHLNDF